MPDPFTEIDARLRAADIALARATGGTAEPPNCARPSARCWWPARPVGLAATGRRGPGTPQKASAEAAMSASDRRGRLTRK